MRFFSTAAVFAGAALALPKPQDDDGNGIPNIYTLTVYNPGQQYDGAKIQFGGGLNLFQDKVRSYCPEQVGSSCPNGTETVFAGSLYPVSLSTSSQTNLTVLTRDL